MEKFLIFIAMMLCFLVSIYLIKPSKIYKFPYVFITLLFALLFSISIKFNFHEIILAIFSFILIVLNFIKRNYLGLQSVYIFINSLIIIYCVSNFYSPIFFKILFVLVFFSFLSFLIINKQRLVKQILFLVSAIIFSWCSLFIRDFILFLLLLVVWAVFVVFALLGVKEAKKLFNYYFK